MRDWKPQIHQAFAPIVPDADMVEELAQHASATYEALRAEGVDPTEAEQRVLVEIRAGAAHPRLRRPRPMGAAAVVPPSAGAQRFAGLVGDLAYAWRLLRRQRSHAALVIVTMALGIAATTVLATVGYAVLLKPLPWADAPRLVRLYETREGSTSRIQRIMTNAAYLAWREPQATTLDALGGWSSRSMTLTGAGEPRLLRLAAVTPGLIEMVGGRPAIGRAFRDGDELPGRTPSIILSYGLWQQIFGGREDVIGQSVRLDGTPYLVVGTMPAGFILPDHTTRAWVPFHVPAVTQSGNPGRYLAMFQAIGRLRADATPSRAAAEGTARARAGPSLGPVGIAVFGSNGPAEVTVIPMIDSLTGGVQPAIAVMAVAVVLLLIAATANVASLQLSRSIARRREFALRAVLGAGGSRLVQQSLIENLLLSLIAGVVGLLLSAAIVQLLPSLLPADFPRIADIAFDSRMRALAVILSILTGVGFGLLPALHAARPDFVPALAEDSLAPVGGSMRSGVARTRALIMAGQVAIACVLLIGAALLGRSFLLLTDAPLGYDPRNLLAARVVLPESDYTPERRLQAVNDILTALAGAPGVTDVAYSSVLPFTSGFTVSSVPLVKRDGTTEQIQAGVREITPGYFSAMGQRVIEGRVFTSADTASTPRTVVVSREFARRYLGGQALGWRVPSDDDESKMREIIGVVEDTVRLRVTDTAEPEMYVAAAQQPPHSSSVHLIVRSTVSTDGLMPFLRRVVRETAPAAPFDFVDTMQNLVSGSLARSRLYSVLLGTFAVFALVVAGVGLFGVLSYMVSQRSREIAVRSALGAGTLAIIGLVARQMALIVGTGIVVGVAASLLLSSGLEALLYGITTTDPVSFVVVPLVLIGVAVLATLPPARRAARIDPIRILRG